VGYRISKEIRGLHPSGYEEIQVQRVDDLSKIDPQRQAIRISRTIGAKKRVEISDRANEMGIHILNPRKVEELEEFEEEEMEKEEELKEEEKS